MTSGALNFYAEGNPEPISVIEYHLGDPETGLWCGECNLPSRVRVDAYALADETVGPFMTLDGCPECGSGNMPKDEAE